VTRRLIPPIAFTFDTLQQSSQRIALTLGALAQVVDPLGLAIVAGRLRHIDVMPEAPKKYKYELSDL